MITHLVRMMLVGFQCVVVIWASVCANNFQMLNATVTPRRVALTCVQRVVKFCHTVDARFIRFANTVHVWGTFQHVMTLSHTLGHQRHWGQPREATVVKMAQTRPLASRSFCLLAPLCDH